MRASLVVLAILLFASAAQAADPNARADISVGHGVNAVGISDDTERILVAMDDDGSRAGLDGPSDQPTWTIYRVLGSSVNPVQEGGVDPSSCSGPPTLGEDCATDAVAGGMAGSGHRAIIAGQVDEDTAQVVLTTDSSGIALQEALSGVVVDAAISRDGRMGAVILDDPSLNTGGRIDAWSWDTTPVDAFDKTLASNPRVLDINSDGSVIVVGTDAAVIRYGPGGTSVVDSQSSPVVNAVAAADDANKVVVAGLGTGVLRVYTKDDGSNARHLNFPGGGVAITALDIRSDASLVAVGRSDGRVEIYPLSSDIILGTPIYNVDHGVGVDDLQFSPDGKTVLVRAGNALEMLAVRDRLVPLWSSTLPSGQASLSISEDGDRVVAGFGTVLRIFEALHDVSMATPSPGPLTPGRTHVLSIQIQNDGNRPETVVLNATATGPATLELPIDTIEVMPGVNAVVALNVTIAENQSPADVIIDLVGEVASGSMLDARIEANIPAITAWAFEQGSGGQASTSKAVDAGAAAEFEFTITNQGNEPGAAPVRLQDTTTGWDAVLVGLDSDVAPGESRSFVVRLEAPDDALDLSVGKTTMMVEGAPTLLQATVGATFGVGLDFTTPIVLGAGETITVQIGARNAGNAKDSLTISLGNLPSGWMAAFASGGSEHRAADLRAGGLSTVGLQLTAPADLGSANLALPITVHSESDPEVTATELLVIEPKAETATPTDKKEPFPFALLPIALAFLAFRRR